MFITLAIHFCPIEFCVKLQVSVRHSWVLVLKTRSGPNICYANSVIQSLFGVPTSLSAVERHFVGNKLDCEGKVYTHAQSGCKIFHSYLRKIIELINVTHESVVL